MADKPSLLIVDDDPLIIDSLAYALGKDFNVMVSDSRSHAAKMLSINRTTLYSRMEHPDKK